MPKITCFGEVLWDIFPSQEKIGGAPLNVALRLQSFGNDVSMISCVGDDKKGNTLLEYMNQNGLSSINVQVHDKLQTGKVIVSLDDKGSATYEILYPIAWDFIELTDDALSLVKQSEAFVFGSLVARDEISRETLYSLIEQAKFKVFDLNLRPPHYSKEVLNYLMEKADFIKFNDDELYEVCKSLGSKYHSLEQNIYFISQKTNSNYICVTKGAHGAVLWYEDTFYYNSGYHVKVVDTVGAGDSFLASLISQLLNNVNPQEAIDFACAVVALVSQNQGANPKISRKQIEKFINP